MIHRKKNRPALQRRDSLTFLFDIYILGNLLSSSFTQFLVVLFFIAFYTAQFSSKHFILRLFVRSLSTYYDCFLLCRVPFSLLSATVSRSLPEPSSTQLLS